MAPHLLDARDLSTDLVDAVLARAAELRTGSQVATRPGLVVGTMFLAASTRTRLGYEVAAARLGGTSVTTSALRVDDAMSSGESFADALRTVTGMVDVLVVRTDDALDRDLVADFAACPVVNGGDAHEHPTQALVDLAAVEAFAGPLAEQHLVLCGDLRMRSVRSLLAVLAARPPARLTLVSPAGRTADVPTPPHDARASLAEVEAPDVVLMTGLPARRGGSVLDDAGRAAFTMTTERLDALPEHAVVLSPMPVIDEIAADARFHPRLRVYEQSDLGVLVRAAVLEQLVEAR